MNWHNKLRNLIKGEKGVIAVAIAVALPVLVGMAGVAVDLGLVYSARSELQNAADAAALAAAGVMIVDDGYGNALVNYDGAVSTTAVFGFSGSGIEVANLHIHCTEAIPALYMAGGDNNYVHDCVIECDGTNCTYGIHSISMKGSRIENCVITSAKTAGIFCDGGADRYCINGGISGNQIYSGVSNSKGIYIESTMTCYNFAVDRNFIQLSSGTSCKGIDNDATGVLITDNYVWVPASATAIEDAGSGTIGNHTRTGTDIVDPDPVAT